MNILQISFDKSFWDKNAPESTLQRQQEYLKVLIPRMMLLSSLLLSKKKQDTQTTEEK